MAAAGNGFRKIWLAMDGKLGRSIGGPYLMREIALSSRIRLPIQYLNRRCYFWFWIALTLACLAAKPGPALAADGLIFAANTGDPIERTIAGLSGSLTSNQRDIGFAQTFNDSADATGADGTDIGAFEAQPATPTPTPGPSTFANISTRLNVGTDDNVLIGGFIITGSQPKAVLIRAIGPSLPLSGTLADPVLQLFDSFGHFITQNDNWRDSANAQHIINSGLPPDNDSEAAILKTLAPGAYTAIVSGANNTTGIGLVEVYDLDATADNKLANISTRGLVQTGAGVMIGGIIVQGDTSINVLIRAIGPSLPLSGTLSDPTLDLHNANGDLIASNDNWKDTQQAGIEATGISPPNDAESAILMSLAAGAYTAIVQGKNASTGIALVEAYQLDP